MAPPSLSHLGSKAQIENAKLAYFLDCISPQSLTGVRNWFRAVVEASSQSDIPGPAVHALSNLFFALQTNDHSLLRESQRLHVEALANLRQDIAEPSRDMAYDALYSTMLLVFYEVMPKVPPSDVMEAYVEISWHRSTAPFRGWSTSAAPKRL